MQYLSIEWPQTDWQFSRFPLFIGIQRLFLNDLTITLKRLLVFFSRANGCSFRKNMRAGLVWCETYLKSAHKHFHLFRWKHVRTAVNCMHAARVCLRSTHKVFHYNDLYFSSVLCRSVTELLAVQTHLNSLSGEPLNLFSQLRCTRSTVCLSQSYLYFFALVFFFSLSISCWFRCFDLTSVRALSFFLFFRVQNFFFSSYLYNLSISFFLSLTHTHTK